MKHSLDEISQLLNEARCLHNYFHKDEEAIKLCDKILKKDSENIDAMLVKAGSLDCLNKEKESFELITEIIEKWPDHWEAYYLLGMLLFNTNEKKALQNFKKSILLDKNFNNVIVTAQLMYFLQDSNYQNYIVQAKKIDPIRFGNYMRNYWEWEIC